MNLSGEKLKFKKIDDEHWDVLNKSAGYQLATIVYYDAWDEWVLNARGVQSLNAEMLRDVISFMEQLK